MKQYDKIYIPDGVIGEVRAKHAVISGKPLVLTEDTNVVVCTVGELRQIFHAGTEYEFFDRTIEPGAEEKAFVDYLKSRGITNLNP